MSDSNETEGVKLTVEAEEPGTEIFLLDDQGQVKTRAVDKLETYQQPGVYKIRLRAGFATHDEIILLENPVRKHYAPLPFFSPVPLQGTACSIESHVRAAEDMSRNMERVVFGEGSEIFLFARDFKCSPNDPLCLIDNPARDLTLRSVDGKTVVDLAVQSKVEWGAEPWAACALKVDPGIYLLSFKMPNGKHIEQTLCATRGWHTQVFLTQRASVLENKRAGEQEEQTIKVPDLFGAAVLVSKTREFRSNDKSARQVEVSRLSLTHKRKVIGGRLRDVLTKELTQPMLGIYGAHLLLLEKTVDVALFQSVINNLRNVFGNSHPDVEALALALDPKASSYVFSAPPMLNQSWKLVVRASAKRPKMVPLLSLAGHVAERLIGSPFWTAWELSGSLQQPFTPEADASRRTDFDSALEAIVSYSSAKFTQPSSWHPEHAIADRVLCLVEEAVGKALGIVSSDCGSYFHHRAQLRASNLKLTDELMEELVVQLQIPRFNVERLLLKNSTHLSDRFTKAAGANV